jgi:hypothetical protein
VPQTGNKKQETDNVFPNIITNGTTSFTKSSIKQAITTYKHLHKINKFYTQHETEPVSDSSDTKNHQAPGVIDIGELTKGRSIQPQKGRT